MGMQTKCLNVLRRQSFHSPAHPILSQCQNQRLDFPHNPYNQNTATKRQAYAYLDGTTAPGP